MLRCWGYLVSNLRSVYLALLFALVGGGIALGATPPDQGYLNIDTAQALADPTKAVAFMTIEIAPDAQFLVKSAAFDFSNGADDPLIDIWARAGRGSRYIVYPGVKDKFGLPPGRYAMVWRWVRFPNGKSESYFAGGMKKIADPESPAPMFEVRPGERVYLGHIRFSYGGTATVTTSSVSIPVGQVPTDPDKISQLTEKMSETSKSERPYVKVTVEDRFDEFATTLPPDIAETVRKSLLVIPKRGHFITIDQ